MSPKTTSGSWYTRWWPILTLINAYESGYKISLHCPTMQRLIVGWLLAYCYTNKTHHFMFKASLSCSKGSSHPNQKSLSRPKLVAPLPISLMTINIYQYPFNFLACFPTSNLIKKLYNSVYFHFSFIFKSIYIHINIYTLLSLFNKWCWNSLISTCEKKKIRSSIHTSH